MDDPPAVCKLAPSPPLQHYQRHLGKPPHAHLCFLGVCHGEAGKGGSTEAEVRSSGRDAAGRHQRGAQILPLCFLLGGRCCYRQGKTFCFHSALRCRSSRLRGKIRKSDATITDTKKKGKLSPLRLTLNAFAKKSSYGCQTSSRRTFTPHCCYSHSRFYSAK